MSAIKRIGTAQHGFTLIEAIVAMVILGIIAAMVAVFVRWPIQGYADSVRRADISDAADAALRRLTREVRLALPNSLRVSCAGATCLIEFIPTSGGGRYRSDGDGTGESLKFGGTSSTCVPAANCQFDILGPVLVAAGDQIAVYNLGSGSAPADAYDCSGAVSCNRASVAGVVGNRVTLAANPFAVQQPPLPSPDSRFQVLPAGVAAVTYSCPAAGVGAPGPMLRYAGYGFTPTQQAPGGTPARVLDNATCSADYVVINSRTALLYLQLNIIDPVSGESATLYQQVHLDNTP